MVSTSTERWSTPRPLTIHLSVVSSNGRTRSARFFSNSLLSRSLMWREVQNFPSRPKKGESLMVKSMLIVGSSTAMGGKASGVSQSAMVSPISKRSKPTTAQISPLLTLSAGVLPMPSKVRSSLIFVFSCVPSRWQMVIFCPLLSVPRCTRPTAIRPV